MESRDAACQKYIIYYHWHQNIMIISWNDVTKRAEIQKQNENLHDWMKWVISSILYMIYMYDISVCAELLESEDDWTCYQNIAICYLYVNIVVCIPFVYASDRCPLRLIMFSINSVIILLICTNMLFLYSCWLFRFNYY